MLARKNPIDFPAALALAHNAGRSGGQGLLISSGQATLVAGTVTVAGQPKIQKNSVIVGSVLTPGGTLGTEYQFVPTATGGGFVLNSIGSAGTVINTDTSVIAWIAFTPAFHADQLGLLTGDNRNFSFTPLQVTAANGTDLPTSLALAANIDSVLRQHLASGGADSVHIAADITDVPANAIPVDLASLQTYLNDVKAKLNTHIANAAYHYFADGTNTITAANASDLPSSQTLANQIKSFLNIHMSIAPGGYSVKALD